MGSLFLFQMTASEDHDPHKIKAGKKGKNEKNKALIHLIPLNKHELPNTA